MEWKIDSSKVYEHQPVTATVTLLSESPDISFVNRISNPEVENAGFEMIRNVRVPSNPARRQIDGKSYYEFPVDAFVFSLSEKGNWLIKAPAYRVGVAERVIVEDPFWGRIPSTRTKSVDLSPKDIKLKTISVPDARKGEGFSGSVGEFKVETVIPKGDIFVGEEATAIVVVSGPGFIAESVMPEYRSAFDHSMRLKSVSESRSEKLVDGKYFSELTLEITFIPESRLNLEIGPVSFDFFNPVSGHHETVRSQPLPVKVGSSTSRRDKIEI